MRIKVGLAQMYPKLGDVQANLEKHLQSIQQADEQGADLIVFPELSLTGYQVQDLVPEVAIRPTSDDATFRTLLDASRQMDIVFGFVHEDKRQRFYTAAAYLSGGREPAYPSQDLSADLRHVRRRTLFRSGRTGPRLRHPFRPYRHADLRGFLAHVAGLSALAGWRGHSDSSSASPSRGLDSGDRLAGSRWVELVNQAYGSMFTNYVIYCNRVGFEDGKNFWGGSSIVDPDGEFVVHGHYFDETLPVQEIDLNQLHRTRARLPLLRDERPELVQRELGRILKRDGA